MQKRVASKKQILLGGFAFTTIVGAIYLGHLLSHMDTAVTLVEQTGYTAVLVLAIITGLNPFVPIPAATLTPVFLAADLTTIGIIIALVIGTTIADAIGFWLGQATRSLIDPTTNSIASTVERLRTNHQRWIMPFVFVYAAFVPFPNEAMLIPLALSGVRLPTILVPLMLGTTLHQTTMVYGVASLSQLF